MRATIWPVAVLILTGCTYGIGGAMSQDQQSTITRESSDQRRAAFTTYSGLCLNAFPDADDMQDDGGQHFSTQGTVNVALTEQGVEYVCSVDISSRSIERVFAGGRSYGAAEFSKVRAELARTSARQEVESKQGFTYKGLAIGDSANVIQQRLPRYHASRYGTSTHSFDNEECAREYLHDDAARERCYSLVSFGGAHVSSGSIFVDTDKVQSIDLTFSATWMSKLREVITARYGEPKRAETPVYQNAYGAKFQGFLFEWEYEGTYLTLSSNGRKDALVVIGSLGDREQSAERSKRAIDRASKDF